MGEIEFYVYFVDLLTQLVDEWGVDNKTLEALMLLADIFSPIDKDAVLIALFLCIFNNELRLLYNPSLDKLKPFSNQCLEIY